VKRTADSDAAWRQLVAAASHDLRTPVTSLRLLAEAVDDQIVDGTARRQYVSRMRTHIDVLEALIDDLFELSRIEAGDVSWRMERCPLGELVTESVAAMAVHAEGRHITVRVQIPDRLKAPCANREKVRRVLFNLIQNAIRHTPSGGEVVVRVEVVGDAVVVEVADTGTGIAPEERQHVFAPFYRGGNDAHRRGAAGLGLAVARAIVEAHGGRIWIGSARRGARVRFSLPVADSDARQAVVIES
jgi:signal transduction histidine kinase